MPNKNAVTIIGHLGRDPEVRFMPNGTALANFSVAVTDKWKGKDGEWQEATEWVKCSVFGDVAELVGEMFHKGDAIHVEGKMKTRKWQDKDGKDVYTTEVNCSYVAKPIYKPKEAKASYGAKEYAARSGGSFNDMPDSDIPF